MPAERVVDGVLLGVPPGWEQRPPTGAGAVLTLVARSWPPSGVVPSVAVTLAGVEPPATAAAHRQRQVDELTGGLHAAYVEDEDCYDLDGHEVAYLRLAHVVDGHDLVAEVWTWLVDGHAWTLTASVALEEYADYAELFEDLAATFEPGVVRRTG